MADKKKLTVAEILAAARKADGGGTGGDEPTPVESAPAEAKADAPEKAASDEKIKPAKSASGGRLSVAEMMAMARAEKDGGPKKAAAAKPAAAKKAKPTPKKAAKAAPTEPRETASILAAARTQKKPGPMSKADAAAKAKANPKPKPAAPAKAKIVVPPMPKKPAAAKKGKKKTSPEMSRDTFLWTGFAALGLVSLAWGAVALKYLFPNVLREPPSKFKVGFPDAYPAGQVQTKFKAQFGVWVSNAEYNGQQQIYALKSVCTHLGCTPSWLDAEQKFKCPCHGSGFYKDGVNFEGPAPRPLERCAIRIADDGQIEIDKSRTFQEEMGQWEDPSCYIPV